VIDAGASGFRVLLFADSRSRPAMVLLRAALRAVREQPGLALAGAVDTAYTLPSPLRPARALGEELAARVFERGAAAPGPRRLAARPWPRGVPRLRAPDVNDAAFVRTVEALRPDGALVLEVGQLFRAPLLAACRNPVNYHDGALPRYRGIAATGWSVYDGEARSGFAFHRMAPGVDDGPILLAGDVAVEPRQTAWQVERAKTRLAARRLGEALDRLVAGDPGRPQEGEPSTYTFARSRALIEIADPASLTWDELHRRLRVAELLRLTLAGEIWEVTALRRGGAGPLAFTTADGVRAAPSRCIHLPVALYRPLRRFRGGR
jgi:hypothetical protein